MLSKYQNSAYITHKNLKKRHYMNKTQVKVQDRFMKMQGLTLKKYLNIMIMLLKHWVNEEKYIKII